MFEIFVAFGAGLISFLSSCVLPLIPGYISYISGNSLNELIEKQNIFSLLDSKPKTLSAKAHRPAYGSDGDYFSKPSLEDIIETAYEIIHEFEPKKFPKLN